MPIKQSWICLRESWINSDKSNQVFFLKMLLFLECFHFVIEQLRNLMSFISQTALVFPPILIHLSFSANQTLFQPVSHPIIYSYSSIFLMFQEKPANKFLTVTSRSSVFLFSKILNIFGVSPNLWFSYLFLLSSTSFFSMY